MSSQSGIDRRAFLRRAGITAVLGAVGARTPLAAETLVAKSGGSSRNYDFDEIYDRFGTDSTKWDGAVASYGEHIEVGMGIADMDFRTAPCITQALAERSAHENWGYLRMPPTFNRSIAEWERRRHGLEVDPSTITLSASVHPAIISGYHAFVPPGARVLMLTPVYNGFYGAQRFARVVAEESPMLLGADGRYSIDWEDFERRIGRVNVFLLCNPQNPTGNCWSPEDLLRLGEICLERRVIVFADEIHCDLTMPGNRYTPFASLPNREVVNNSITFKSLSKTFSLAGLKVAWYYSTNRDLLERIRSHTRADLSTPAIVASQAALEEGDDWLDQVRPYIAGNHELVESYVRENIPFVKCRAAQGTFLAWLDIRELAERIGAAPTAIPSQAVQNWLAEHAAVALTPGSGFGVGGAGHMRMNIATARPVLRKALDNMAEAVARL